MADPPPETIATVMPPPQSPFDPKNPDHQLSSAASNVVGNEFKASAASVVAKSNYDFRKWCKAVRVLADSESALPKPAQDMYDYLPMAPPWLLQPESSWHPHLPPKYLERYQHLCKVEAPPVDEGFPSDKYAWFASALVLMYDTRVTREILSGRQPPPAEASWRLDVDNLISHAVNTHDSSLNLICRLEVVLNLPQAPNEPYIAEAKADSVVFHQEEDLDEDRPEIIAFAQCDTSRTDKDVVLDLLLWASEYKRDSPGQNQLTFDLVSGLWQRRILGLTSQVVYGLTTSASAVEVWAGWWKGDRICVRSLRTFNFRDFGSIVKFYLMFDRIMQYGEECIKEYRTLTAEQRQIARSNLPTGFFWRSNSLKRKPSSGGSNNSRKSKKLNPAVKDGVHVVAHEEYGPEWKVYAWRNEVQKANEEAAMVPETPAVT